MTDIIEARDRLELLRQELSSAEAEAESQRRAGLIEKLGKVREERRAAEAKHREVAKRLHPEQEDRYNAQQHVLAVLEQLRDSMKARPAVASYLPDDPEVVAWRKAHEALEAKRDQLIAARDALPNPEVTIAEANRYAGPSGILATLHHTERNLLRAIEGKGPVLRIEGGVFGVE